MFFDLLGLSCSWLLRPSGMNDQIIHVQARRAIVATVKTTSDVAERGVKLLTEFSQLFTKDELKR